MALSLFTAQAIFTDQGRYVFADPYNTITINGAQVAPFAPRNCWLLRTLLPGQNQVQYSLTFNPTSADLADVNTIQGIWVESGDDVVGVKGVMINCISIADFNSVANGTGTITPRYNGAPAFTTPTPNWWCVTRADAGTGAAHDDVVTDYLDQYVGNVRLKSNTSGVSVYTFQSYSTVKPVGADTVAQC